MYLWLSQHDIRSDKSIDNILKLLNCNSVLNEDAVNCKLGVLFFSIKNILFFHNGVPPVYCRCNGSFDEKQEITWPPKNSAKKISFCRNSLHRRTKVLEPHVLWWNS